MCWFDTLTSLEVSFRRSMQFCLTILNVLLIVAVLICTMLGPMIAFDNHYYVNLFYLMYVSSVTAITTLICILLALSLEPNWQDILRRCLDPSWLRFDIDWQYLCILLCVCHAFCLYLLFCTCLNTVLLPLCGCPLLLCSLLYWSIVCCQHTWC